MSSVKGQFTPAEDEQKQEDSRKKTPCPKCNSLDDAIPLIFGYPSQALMEKAQKGEVALGGCCPPMPGQKQVTMHCKKCKDNF